MLHDRRLWYTTIKNYMIFSINRGFELICPVQRYEHTTPADRLELIQFYESELGQAIYSWRSKSIEYNYNNIT